MNRDSAPLVDMLNAARLIAQFTKDVTFESFSSDEMLQSAVRYQQQVIGEAAGSVSPEFRRAHGEIPWEKLIGMRHRLVHGYREMLARRVWQMAQNDVGPIILSLEHLVPRDDDQ